MGSKFSEKRADRHTKKCNLSFMDALTTGAGSLTESLNTDLLFIDAKIPLRSGYKLSERVTEGRSSSVWNLQIEVSCSDTSYCKLSKEHNRTSRRERTMRHISLMKGHESPSPLFLLSFPFAVHSSYSNKSYQLRLAALLRLLLRCNFKFIENYKKPPSDTQDHFLITNELRSRSVLEAEPSSLFHRLNWLRLSDWV